MLEGLHKIVTSDETIVAISTPLGRSAIAVVRMSGGEAVAIAKHFFKPHSPLSFLEHRKATVGMWFGLDGQEVDEVVVTLFVGPSSYTGEDVLEVSGHGNPLIMGRIVETARSLGARIAGPGEFTLRAVAHGRMDLIQAEAVREFVDAQTEEQARIALRQLGGALSKRIQPIKDQLVDIISRLEAGIDFADDDVEVPDSGIIQKAMRALAADLEALQETFGYGRMLVGGLRLVILGKPNVGKSSLFNRLVAADRAIVTDIPGTTRDVLTETVSIDGVPLRFADTAGIHETTDRVESLGVARTLETLSDADLALVVLDSSRPLDEDDRRVLSKASMVAQVIVLNKSDLSRVVELPAENGIASVHLSAKTGQGIDLLRDAIRAVLRGRKTDMADDLVLTSTRQHEAIVGTVAGLHAALDALAMAVPHEMVLLDLYQALSCLGELTGEVVTDDILGRIFSTFCVGK